MDTIDVKGLYEQCRKRHQLPPFGDLDAAYDIGRIDDDHQLPREIRKRMLDRIGLYLEVLEGILSPENSLTPIYESGFYSDEEKKDLFLRFRELMALKREALLLEQGYDEAAECSYIKENHPRLTAISGALRAQLAKLKDGWQETSEAKFDAEYLG
ncbi:hypothetical protein JXB02_02535 [Candidatus Woesearchaeota archaeon]|nr:hypothetical protein [Candidatus Woesearchaeota archaeon]